MVPYPKRPGRPLTHILLPRTPVPVRSCADPSRPYNDGVVPRTPVPSPARPRADLSRHSNTQARHAGRRAAPFPRVDNSATPKTKTPYSKRPCAYRTATSHPRPATATPGHVGTSCTITCHPIAARRQHCPASNAQARPTTCHPSRRNNGAVGPRALPRIVLTFSSNGRVIISYIWFR